MGTLVESQLSKAIQVLKGEQTISAEDVINADKQVNAMEITIDEACVTLIARRQPVAHDLRFIITILKTASELERIGDTVGKICRTVLNQHISRENMLLQKLEILANQSIAMLYSALRALRDMKLEEATIVYQQDKEIDLLYQTICEDLATLMKQQVDDIDRLIPVLLCARGLERIGDRSQNICEFVYYYLIGKIPQQEDIIQEN